MYLVGEFTPVLSLNKIPTYGGNYDFTYTKHLHLQVTMHVILFGK